MRSRERQRAELRLAGDEGQVEPLAVPSGVAGAENAAGGRQRRARRTGRLECGLDDDVQQLVRIVGCLEGLADAIDRGAQARALLPELLDPPLELVCHLVERV